MTTTSLAPSRLNGWAKMLVGLLPLAGAGLIAWGTLRSDVNALARNVEAKASRETMQTQYDAIQRQLSDIQQQLRELRSRR